MEISLSFYKNLSRPIKPYHHYLPQLHYIESEHTSLITPPPWTTSWIWAHVCLDKLFMRTQLSLTLSIIPHVWNSSPNPHQETTTWPYAYIYSLLSMNYDRHTHTNTIVAINHHMVTNQPPFFS